MNDEKETRKKLLESARKEFKEKGYHKASLRNICKNAGVTTGALYFFFKDKDDLFASLVKKPLEEIYQLIEVHYKQEREDVKDGSILVKDFTLDFELAYQLLDIIYEQRDDFLLLLTESEETSAQKKLDEIIERTEEHYRLLSDALAEQMNQPQIEEVVLHWIAHHILDIFIYMVTHIEEKEEGRRYLNQVMRYTIGGWYAMFDSAFGQKKNSKNGNEN